MRVSDYEVGLGAEAIVENVDEAEVESFDVADVRSRLIVVRPFPEPVLEALV